MAKTAANIKALGPGTLTWGSDDLGYVQNVRFKWEEVVEEVVCDSFAAPIGAMKHGPTCELTALLEESALASLVAASNQGALATALTTTGTVTNTHVQAIFGSDSGGAASAKALKFAPEGNTPTFDLHIHKAFVATSPREITLNGKEPARYEVIFRGMIDTTKTDGNYLFSIGDNAS
jgi:hypothetical protein